MPSVRRAKSCLSETTRAFRGSGGGAGGPAGFAAAAEGAGAVGAPAVDAAGAAGAAAAACAAGGAPPAAGTTGGLAAAPGGGSAGLGIWINFSPLNPDVVGSLSWAGTSSFRTYLSGSSQAISNSIGTRFCPRTWRVRPVATNALTAESAFSPPSASRAAASTADGSLPSSPPAATITAPRQATATTGSSKRMGLASRGPHRCWTSERPAGLVLSRDFEPSVPARR